MYWERHARTLYDMPNLTLLCDANFAFEQSCFLRDLVVLQLQDLEQKLGIGQPLYRTTSHKDPTNIQAIISRMTYQEGCAFLFESAKQDIGADKVLAVCEGMVQTFFLRGKQCRHGLDWLNKTAQPLSLAESLTPLIIVDEDQNPVAVADRFHNTKHIADFAKLSVEEITFLMQEFLPLFAFEMKQRGFTLRHAICDSFSPLCSIRHDILAWELRALHPEQGLNFPY